MDRYIKQIKLDLLGEVGQEKLFNEANSKWNGVFSEGAKIELTASHLSVCVSSIQDVKLFNSNLQIIDEAFEYLVNKSAKGEKGQYFTPRHVIDMCVKMLNPKKGEYMIDTAAGSCGFTVHTIFWLTKHLFENKEISNEDFVEIKILDKVSSKTSQLKLNIQQEAKFENLIIKVLKCKNSEFDDDPEITAYMQVQDVTIKSNDKVFIFNGWTFSSSPSVSLFDHPVYDIWLTKCY